MNASPRVLVPIDLTTEEARAFRVRRTYLTKLLRYELTPILVAPGTPMHIVDNLYQECAGVLLIGGVDIDPARYGAERHPLTEESVPERDELELFVTQKALKDKKPILGICRGCQLLNVAAGGTLIQHIESDVVRHKLPKNDETYAAIKRQSNHAVSIVPGSRAALITGKEQVLVNSAHHQAVEQVGKNLIISGTAPDGIVEIVEHQDPSYFCFGLQSHPEAEENGDLEPFFKKFAEAAEACKVI